MGSIPAWGTMRDYTVLRSIGGLYLILGWVTMLGAMIAFVAVAIQAPDPFKWLSVVAGAGGIIIGASLLGASELLAAIADTAQSATQSTEALEDLTERLDKLIELQTRAAADLEALAGTVKARQK